MPIKPAYEREPPHCPTCACGVEDTQVERIRQVATQAVETLRACGSSGPFSVGIAWAALGLILAEFGDPQCSYCHGNDRDMPCAYPSEGKPGCLRDLRLRREDQLKKDNGNVNE